MAEEIERRHRKVREKYEVTYDRVLEEIAKIAYSNIADYMSINQSTGEVEFDFSDADAAVLAGIGEIQVDTRIEGTGEDACEVKRIRVKPHNKSAALDMLMRHAGLSKDKASGALADLAERIAAGQKRLAGSESQ